MSETKNVPCATCGTPITLPVFRNAGGDEIFGRIMVHCDDCVEKARVEEAAVKARQRIMNLEKEWESICPPLYRGTDPNHPDLSPAVRAALRAWNPDGETGLALIGTTGKGKTRLAFARLRELHMEGYSVFAVSAKKIERAIQDTFSDDKDDRSAARGLIWSAEDAGILLLDDVGKEKYTERVASEFYALVEERTSNLRPTIWTANTSATELTRRLGAEHGDATVRRLMEFSEIVTV